MIHKYKINGMTCPKCADKVKKALERIEGIQNAVIDLENGEAEITMAHHIPTSIMNNSLTDTGNYSIKETETVQKEMSSALHNDEVKKPFFSAYKPIVLVFAFLTGISVLNEINTGSFQIARFLGIFMGGFFITFSFFKLLDLRGFTYSYSSYDIIAKHWLGWGFIYPFVELTLGLAFLFGFDPVVTNISTMIIMGVSSIGVLQSLLAKRKFQCACLGTVFNLPMSNITLTEDLLMVSMAGAMLII